MSKFIPMPLSALLLILLLSTGPVRADQLGEDAKADVDLARKLEDTGSFDAARVSLARVAAAAKKARASQSQDSPMLDAISTRGELISIRMAPKGADKAALTVKTIDAGCQRIGSRMNSRMADAIIGEALITAERELQAKRYDRAEVILSRLAELELRLDEHARNGQRLLSDYDVSLHMQGKVAAAEKLELTRCHADYRIPYMAAQAMASEHGRKQAVGAAVSALKLAAIHASADDVAQVRLALAGYYMHTDQYAKVVATLDKCLPYLLKKYPASPSTSFIEAQTQRLISLAKLGKTKQAQAAYADLLDSCKKCGNPQETENAKAVAQMLGIK